MEGIYKGSTANCASTGLYASQIDPHEIIYSLSRGLQAGAYLIWDRTLPKQPYGSSHFSQLVVPNMLLHFSATEQLHAIWGRLLRSQPSRILDLVYRLAIMCSVFTCAVFELFMQRGCRRVVKFHQNLGRWRYYGILQLLWGISLHLFQLNGVPVLRWWREYSPSRVRLISLKHFFNSIISIGVPSFKFNLR